MKRFVENRVHDDYWHRDLNCASTTLRIMAEHFGIRLDDQVLDAAIGMHGAGGHRAQCGIVEGTLMFIGILGRQRSIPDDDIISFCREFAEKFQTAFGSIVCATLRPEGFAPDQPPHLCERLTVEGIVHNITLISNRLSRRTPEL